MVVRFRPQQNREIREGGEVVAHFDGSGKNVSMNGSRKAAFTFDRVFPLDATQEDVYGYAARPIVEDVLKGYNGTIFAYGQTSSGKTHTMEGPNIDSDNRGVIPRIVQDIFGYIELAPEDFEFTVRISYFEIYMEKIRDLLADGNDNLQIHEDRDRGVYVRHATELYMQSPDEVLDVIKAGAVRRSCAQTNMNDLSSRSHAVVLLEITQKDTVKGGSKTGKLYLVDLAGSEKVSKTGADGSVLDEAKNINKSLSALGLVIMSLTEGNSRSHIPYRDSKLTRILQESLGGNARTTIICCCSPSSHNETETLSTLNFGKRAKKIKNCAKVNVQYSAEALQKQVDELKAQMKKLVKQLVEYEKELEIWRSGGTVSEEDRAALSNVAQAEIKAQDVAATVVQQETGLSDEERESFMQRESELLDLLDDKDEEIRELTREMDQLAGDKITISRLASDVHGKAQAIAKLETQLEQMQEDHALYESNIEELVGLNENAVTERDELQLERDTLLQSIEIARKETAMQLQQTGEQITAMIAAKTGGRQLPQVPGGVQLDPLVEVPLNRAKQFVSQLQQQGGSMSSEEQLAVQERLDQALLSKTELEGKCANLQDSKSALETEIAGKDAKLQEREAEMTNIIAQMIEMEMMLAEKGDASSQEVSQTREIEASAIKSLQQEKSELANQIKDLKAKHEAALQSAEDAQMQIGQLQLDLKNVQQSPAVGSVFSDATNIKIEQFKNLRRKMASQLLAKTRAQAAPAVSGGIDFKAYWENKLEQKNVELNKFRSEKRGLEKEKTAKDARINEMRNQMKLKENKINTLSQFSKSLQQNIKVLKEETKNRQPASRGVRGGRQGSDKPISRGVRGGGAGGSGRDRSGRQWPGEDRAESVKRKERAVQPPAPDNPEQVEYV